MNRCDRPAHITDRPLAANGVWAAWPLAFGSAPGAYMGAVMLLAVLFAWRDRAHRALVVAFGGCLVLTWLLMLNVIVTAGWFQTLLLKVPFGDVYLHNPGRMRYLVDDRAPRPGRRGPAGLRDRPMTPPDARWALAGGVALLIGCRWSPEGSPLDSFCSPSRCSRPYPRCSGWPRPASDGRCPRSSPWWGSSSSRARCTRACTRRHDLHRSRDGRASQPRAPGRCRTRISPRASSCARPRSSTSSGTSPTGISRTRHRRRASTRGTCSRSDRRTGRRSPWSAGRCSASPTCWATTRCSSLATGRTSARPTRTRSSTTRPCWASRRCRTCG